MSSMPAFPKIFALGSPQTERIFNGEVEITEKLDGSQIGFGNIDGELIIRSKGQRIYPETVDKMFKKAVEVILNLSEMGDGLRPNACYYGEYLSKNKHNVLSYDTVPKNNIALYGIVTGDGRCLEHDSIKNHAERLGLDVAPLLYKGYVNNDIDYDTLLKTVSYLGGQKIEGIVVKNYNEQLLIGGQIIPILMGKYVSEEFKEFHKADWKKENTGKGRFEVYKSQFKSPARWAKAVQHLRDKGELTSSPKDIGKLFKEVNQDLEEEEKENIKEWLWNEFGKEVLRGSTHGLPEWYKKELLNNCIGNTNA